MPYFANTKSEIDFYFVDQLGMYVPFLVRYAKEFDDKNAYAIAKKNLDYWCLVYISFNRIYTDRLILFKYSISVVENIRKTRIEK